MEQQPDGCIVVDDPDYGVVEFRPDGSVAAEGRTLDPSGWTVAETPTHYYIKSHTNTQTKKKDAHGRRTITGRRASKP